MAAENNIVGEVGLRVTPVDPGFNAGVQKIIDRLEQQAQFRVAANTKPAEQAVASLAGQIENGIGGAWAQASIQAAGFTAALYGIDRAVNGVLNKFSGLFDGIAKARAGFTSILGGADKANTLLGQVRQFAIDSPFVTSELVRYSQQLLGVGRAAGTIVPTLKSVGDIVASVGGDTQNIGSILYALTQIQSIGKLTGQDARQLQNQLVPITKYIADYTHQTIADVKKLQEGSGISADVVFAAIENRGKQVVGAMNASVRTIQGAKSVLSDTLTNIFQSNKGLNNIYDDIVKGIQAVAAKLSDPAVQGAITAAIDGIASLYEALKPVVAGLVAFGASTGLTFLNTFGTVLETISGVIKQFPAGFLQAIGIALGGIAALKAPFLLIKYAENLRTLTSGIFGLAAAHARETVAEVADAGAKNLAATATQRLAITEIEAATAAQVAAVGYEQQTLALEGLAVASTEAAAAETRLSLISRARQNLVAEGTKGGVGTAISVAGVVGGSLLKANTAGTNTLSQTAGSAAIGGGIGFQVAGAPGAAIGAALGAVTGYLGAEKAKLQASIKEMQTLGTEHAEAFLKANAKAFETATPESAVLIDTQFETLKAQIARNKDQIEGETKRNILKPTGGFLAQLNPFAKGGLAGGGDGLTDQEDQAKKIRNLSVATKGLVAEQAKLKETYTSIVVPIQDAALAASVFNKTAFVNNAEGHGKVAGQVKDFNELELAFRSYGVTSAEVVAMGAEKFASLVEQIEGLDTAQKKAVLSANNLAAAIKEQSATVKVLYETQISNLGAQIAAASALETAKKSAGAALTGDPLAPLQASEDTLKAQQSAEDFARGSKVVEIDNKITAAKKANNLVLGEALAKGKDAAVVAAGQAAANNVLYQTVIAHTKAIQASNDARERQLRLNKISLNEQQISSATGLKTAGSGLASAIVGGDTLAISKAQAEADKAVIAAGDAASALATANLQITRSGLIAAGLSTDAVDSQIRLTGEVARTAAETIALTGVEKEAAVARKLANADAIEFLQNLSEGQRQAALIFGAGDAVDAARASALNATASASSAITAALTDGATALEKATVLTAADSARQTIYAAVLAETHDKLLALATAQDIHNTVIAAAAANINAEVDQVVGLNSSLDTLEGRKIVASIILQGVTEALAQINVLELQLSHLFNFANSNIGLQNQSGVNAAIGGNKKQQDDLKKISGGQLPPDVLSGIAVKAAAQLPKEKADNTAQKAADALASAFDAMVTKVQSAADAIASAAEKWVGSIKERTQYETAVSASRLTKNTNQQIKDLTEVQSGLANLRSRGVSESVLNKLDINNVSDTRQVRKLVNASDAELATLVASVNRLDTKASEVAQTAEETRTRKNIANAIIDAAKTLGLDKPTSAAAAGLAAQFVIQPGINSEEVAQQILEALTSGRLG